MTVMSTDILPDGGMYYICFVDLLKAFSESFSR